MRTEWGADLGLERENLSDFRLHCAAVWSVVADWALVLGSL